jgi:hypothetical protein
MNCVTSVDPMAIVNECSEFLFEQGFEFCSCSGVAQKPRDNYCLGILQKDFSAKRSILGIIPLRSRKRFIATIWFYNIARKGDSKHWVIDTFGREYFYFVKKIAEELSSRFNVDIRVELKTEEPRFETYMSDYDCC